MKGMSKRGRVSTMGVVMTVLAIVVVGYIIFAFALDDTSANDDPAFKEQLSKIFTSTGGATLNLERVGKEGTAGRETIEFLFQYVFGMHKGTLENVGVDNLSNLSIRGLMILISVWIIFLLIFVDMSILVMGHRSAVNGFLIGLAVSVMFANFGLYYNLIIWLMGIFSFLAGLSVVAALFSIIVLGVGAHFGAGWALTAIKTKSDIWRIRGGADKAAEGIRAAKTIAEGASS